MSKPAKPLPIARIALCFCMIATTYGKNRHAVAHQDHSHGQAVTETEPAAADPLTETADTPSTSEKPIPLIGPSVEAFQAFTKTVSARVDGQALIVESNGLPSHGMMIGIRAWQQQVPLPQPFTGDNAWRLPLRPRPASDPISVLNEPLRGAIALAVNGVPIFCALNNRGDDTYLAGELDQWGGHCGRGDDYHYHIAPTHLENQVGVGNPIAFALDGYPILGLNDKDGSTPSDLDRFNGHSHDGSYHYHATKGFPYINGGLHGVVTMDGDQIRQPRDAPVRPGQPPLRGAIITDFTRSDDRFDLEYELSGRKAHVKYAILGDDQFEFTYVDTSGKTSTEVYQRSRTRRGTAGFHLWWFVPIALALVGIWSLVKRTALRQRFPRTTAVPGDAGVSEKA